MWLCFSKLLYYVYYLTENICGMCFAFRIVTYDSQAKAINAVDVLGSLKLGDRPLRAKIYMPGAGKTRRENQETHIAQIY